MTTTSLKYRNFVDEPMSNKPVTDLAGIGPTIGKRLSDRGYDKAYLILGQFLVLKKNQYLFIDWLRENTGANKKCASDCDQCLRHWCDEFL